MEREQARSRTPDRKHESRGSHRTPITPGIFVLALATAVVLWLVFVASFNSHELMVGGACVLLTMAFMHSVARSMGLKLELRLQDVAQAYRIPLYELMGNWTVVLVLFKDLLHIAPAQNCFRVCGFDSSRHDPVRASRTVLAVAFTTASPNSIVIGIDPAQSRMLFHQISPTGVQRMAKALGAKG